jgi:nucleoside-diphosphate-sugar epimerase
MLYLASKQHKYVFTSLRFFQVFGPRKFLNPKHDVTTFFIDCVLRQEGIVVIGPNTFIDILGFTEAAVASYLVFTAVASGTILNSVNIGSGDQIKLCDLYYSLVDDLVGGARNMFSVPPKRQTRSLVADISKLSKLGWEPEFPVEHHLVNTIAHMEKAIHAALR